jgi:luciferase family oxidoreductase group 1
MKTPVISALDFVTVRQGKTPREAIARSAELAQHVEKLGYHRFWVPEHHNVALSASCAPAVLIGYIAGATQSIRVGAGGVMLLNHAPLVIAEQFGTLESIYPGRIDLGLGRAAGTSTAQEEMMKKVLRRDPQATGDNFPKWLAELQSYLEPELENQEVKSGPGQGTNVPMYLLSSSGYSAQLAGELGLPFAFAAHIAAQNLESSLDLYRRHFRPSKTLQQPYVMIATFALAAETEEEARKSFTSAQQLYLSAVRSKAIGAQSQAKLLPPVESMDGLWSDTERQAVEKGMSLAIVGGRKTVGAAIQSLLQQTGADELIFWSEAYDYTERLRSCTILAEAVKSLSAEFISAQPEAAVLA